MKKLMVLSAFIGICLMINSQTPEVIAPATNDIVINQSVIDRFNNIEYSADQIDFAYILMNYSFDDAKNVISAYRSGEIENTTTQSVDSYLAQIKNENKTSETAILNKAESQLLATQQ